MRGDIRMGVELFMMNNKKKLIIGIVVLVVIIGMIIYGMSSSKVDIEIEDVTIELGSTLEVENLNLELEEEIMETLIIQDETVDYEQVGTYEATLLYNSEEIPFVVIIEDTTAPELVLLNEVVDLAVNEEVSIDDLVYGFDYSAFTVAFQDTTYIIETETVCFIEEGTYENTVIATDVYDNATELCRDIIKL